MGLAFDPSVNIGQILEIVSFVGGGMAAFVMMRSDIKVLGGRMEKVETQMQKQTDILIVAAKQDIRLGELERRMNSAEFR